MSPRTGWLAMVLVAITLAAAGKPTAPTGLLVNGVSQPLAIDREVTRFTWCSANSRRGDRQTAYRILVSSSPESLAAEKGDWWDSGKVVSANSASVRYAGAPLPAATRCWWKVRVWDQTGEPSRYSAPAYFDTGLASNEWTAQYIWDGTTNLNNFAYFRKSFGLSGRPALAKVYVTAHNDYLLYLNGRELGRGPARCDPYHYGQYNAYDITRLLRMGTNVFTAIGHWQGNWRDSGVNAQAAFLLETRVSFADGSHATVGTDASWKVLAQTAFMETNAVYFGGAGGASNRAAIQFDANREPAHWMEASFDDSCWLQATVQERPGYCLFAQVAGLEREQAELRPVAVQAAGRGWLVDFGRCIDGWPKLTLRANRPGDTVRVEYFQRNGQRGPSGWDGYTCRGGRETWKPGIGRHTSFQMLRISGYAGRLRPGDVHGVWAYTEAEVAGRFHCSSELLNGIYQMCERSARQNVQQGIISVDANREQSPWTADSWNIGNVLLYNHRNTRILEKVVRDYAGEQLACGDFCACSPAGMFRIPEWSMYWPMLLWQEYLFSGNEELVGKMAPRLSAFLNWLKTHQEPATKLLNPPDIDFSQGKRISEYAGGNLPSGGANIATSSQYYENLRIAAKVFSLLGRQEEAQQYAQDAAEVRAGINTHLFNGRYYLARPDRREMFPLASAWALRFDLVPEAAKPAVREAIHQAGKAQLGGYGGDAFYSGLWEAGRMGDYIVADLARYRPMLAENQANWESFGSRGEFNHAWTAYPAYLFPKYISGIQPTGGGFSSFEIRPEITGLDFAESTVPTVKGLVRTRWEKRSNGRLALWLTVPGNTRATVYIPKLTNRVTLRETGARLWPPQPGKSIRGVVSVEEVGEVMKVVLEAGSYRFLEERRLPGLPGPT